jgi:hypothetical protein
MIMPKLKDCCVARAAFSVAESSFHGTNPSSLKAVTVRLRGPVGVVPRLFCVAYDRAKVKGRDALEAPTLLTAGRVAKSTLTGFIVDFGRLPSYQDQQS